MYQKIKSLLIKGFFDEDENTPLLEEIKNYFSQPKGSYSKQISKILKHQSNYKLGKHSINSFGESWNIIKPYSSKIINLEQLTLSIQDVLSKAGCDRIIGFVLNPLRLVLYFKKPKAIDFESVESLMTKDNLYPFVLTLVKNETMLASINPNDERFAHVLVSGITGSGKSMLLKTFICSMKDTNAVYFCNPKNDKGYKDLEHIKVIQNGGYYNNLESIENCITKIGKETKNRLNKTENFSRIFLVVDELSLLSKQSKTVLTEIANIGRSLKVHLILATQRPTKETIPSTLKAQMSYTLTGRVSNKREAYYASGVSNSGAEYLQGAGLFILNASGYNNQLVQGIYLEKIPDNLIVEKEIKTKEEPKYIESRKRWLDSIDWTTISTKSALQKQHKQYYGKALNTNTAQKILEWNKK